MSQNREAPAYQEYAASMMAQIPYRVMTLQERGLLYSMRHECWVNGKLPERPGLLAKVLGFSEQEIQDSLPAVMPFFAVSEGSIFSPELEDYRKHLLERKEKQSKGGKVGSALTNKKRYPRKNRIDSEVTSTPSSNSSSMTTTDSRVPRRGQLESLVKLSTVQTSQNQSLEKEVTPDPFIVAMEEEEARIGASSKVRVTV